MKVLFTATNQIKDVKDGYALNFLFPKGMAISATPKVLAKLAQQAQQKEAEIQEKLSEYEKLARELNGKLFRVTSKANREGELFGGVTRQHIKKLIKVKAPVEVKLDKPIKRVGKHPVTVKLGRFKAIISVEVSSS